MNGTLQRYFVFFLYEVDEMPYSLFMFFLPLSSSSSGYYLDNSSYELKEGKDLTEVITPHRRILNQ